MTPRLSRATLRARPRGLGVPSFLRERVRPGIVHLGLGGFHRAHMARYTHDLIADRAWLEETYSLRDACPVFCEPYIQWAIEDTFPAGRPAWESVGAQLVEDVTPYELMKLRLLNGS